MLHVLRTSLSHRQFASNLGGQSAPALKRSAWLIALLCVPLAGVLLLPPQVQRVSLWCLSLIAVLGLALIVEAHYAAAAAHRRNAHRQLLQLKDVEDVIASAGSGDGSSKVEPHGGAALYRLVHATRTIHRLTEQVSDDQRLQQALERLGAATDALVLQHAAGKVLTGSERGRTRSVDRTAGRSSARLQVRPPRQPTVHQRELRSLYEIARELMLLRTGDAKRNDDVDAKVSPRSRVRRRGSHLRLAESVLVAHIGTGQATFLSAVPEALGDSPLETVLGWIPNEVGDTATFAAYLPLGGQDCWLLARRSDVREQASGRSGTVALVGAVLLRKQGFEPALGAWLLTSSLAALAQSPALPLVGPTPLDSLLAWLNPSDRNAVQPARSATDHLATSVQDRLGPPVMTRSRHGLRSNGVGVIADVSDLSMAAGSAFSFEAVAGALERQLLLAGTEAHA